MTKMFDWFNIVITCDPRTCLEEVEVCKINVISGSNHTGASRNNPFGQPVESLIACISDSYILETL